MAIPVEQRTIDILKKLTRLTFRRDLVTNELRIETEYTTGYDEIDGRFVPLTGNIRTLNQHASRWLLGRTVAQAGADANVPIGQLLVTVFDALESGTVTIPLDPNAPTEAPQA